MDTNDSPLNCIPPNEWDALIISILKPFFPLCTRDTLITREDLQQEAWISLLIACERYDSLKGKFVTFAYHYIRGRVMRYVSKVTRNKPHQIDNDRTYIDAIEDDKGYIDTTAERNDFMKTIFSLVSDQKHTELLHEHFINNKSFRQIAKEIDTSHVSVANRVNKLLDVLETRLENENA
jgi:RNA polymerase sigma factor (sigma-70 family)